jgi:hypothetical protein
VKLVTALVVMLTCGPVVFDAAAQSVSTADRDALVRLRVDRGGRPEDVDALLRHADEAAAKGLPSTPLTNKIREGLAKGHDPQRIDAVVRQMVSQLEAADQMLREVDRGAAGPSRDASVTLLAESFGSGVTANDIRELRRQTQADDRPPVSGESIASAAKGLAYIRDARLPVSEGTGVIAAAVRRGFRPHEVLDLGREIKRRERDFVAGRSTLGAVRDAIARGDRPEQLFRDGRREAGERPAAARPAPRERPARPERPERPDRPEAPQQRPERPERPARPQ